MVLKITSILSPSISRDGQHLLQKIYPFHPISLNMDCNGWIWIKSTWICMRITPCDTTTLCNPPGSLARLHTDDTV